MEPEIVGKRIMKLMEKNKIERKELADKIWQVSEEYIEKEKE